MLIRLFGTANEEFFRDDHRWFRGSLSPKDRAILWGLHTARVMSAVQIAAEVFPGQQVAKARTRLNRLRKMGLVERHRGGRPTGSESFLWSLTPNGFRHLSNGMAGALNLPDDPHDLQPWHLPDGAKFHPWGRANVEWGSDLPGRIKHDLQTTDFLISYRRLVDSIINAQIGRGHFVTEWRGEHAFLPPLDQRHCEPVQIAMAAEQAFGDPRRLVVQGFPEYASLQVVKPDGALSIILTDPGGKRSRLRDAKSSASTEWQ